MSDSNTEDNTKCNYEQEKCIIIEKLKSIGDELVACWENIYGESTKSINIRCKNFKNYVLQTLEAIKLDEFKARDTIVSKIEDLKTKIRLLEAELCKESHDLCNEERGLLKFERDLLYKQSILISERKELLDRQEMMQSEENQLCIQLKETQVYIPSGELASQSQTKEIFDNICRLKSLRDSRLIYVKNCRQNIRKISDNLTDAYFINTSTNCKSIDSGHSSMDEHDTYIKPVMKTFNQFFDLILSIATNDQSLIDSDSFRRLKLLESNIQKIESDKFEIVKKLTDEIQSLLKRLPKEETEKYNIGDLKSSCGPKTIWTLTCYKENLMIQRSKHMERFIEDIRKDICDISNKCFINDNSILKLEYDKIVYSEIFTEEVLIQHEKILKDFNKYYSDNKFLFDKIYEWVEMWETFIILESKMQDPSRFKNRGGNLLKEERERVKVKNHLPKCEKKILNMISKWEEENNKSFFVNNTTFSEFIEDKKKLYEFQKMETTRHREEIKRKKTENELLYGSKFSTPSKKIITKDNKRKKNILKPVYTYDTPKKQKTTQFEFKTPIPRIRTLPTLNKIRSEEMENYPEFEEALSSGGKKKQSSFMK
ncbi:hypothetical protein A3Q56_07302 [Intoshia linei]|uniref:Protein regulator of cytokinesis 1 n=1 Tax=Intoshia linei TaxID=1819745 RepID=A0A177ASK7_9BILA|nr:hypothetical protein A3Q56_07302 [Intoshia linei]